MRAVERLGIENALRGVGRAKRGEPQEKAYDPFSGAADETGWRSDGKNGWLWALTTPTQTLYHADKSRSGAVIEDLLGKAFGGTLVSDFYSAYSKLDCKKQKCLVHLLRELTETAEKSPLFAAGDFFQKCKRLVKEMLLLKGRWSELGDEQYTARACRLEDRLEQLASADYEEAHARRIGKRLRKFGKELTAFLWDKDLEGTNNAAERAIRPMVVARKISGAKKRGHKPFSFLGIGYHFVAWHANLDSVLAI